MTCLNWLRLHTQHLRTYKANEIANLGMACGFSLHEICYALLRWYMEIPLEGVETDLIYEWMYLQAYESMGWEFKD